MSMRPNRSLPDATSCLTCAASVTSVGRPSACAPVCSAIAAVVSASVVASRAQRISDAPSAASSSATARPSPRLAATTSATLFLRPRSIGSNLFLPEIVVRLVEPVLSWRAEDVDVERVGECFRFVLHVRRDVQDFAGEHVHDLRLVFTDPEAQAAFEDVGDLLVLVRVTRHDSALLEIDMGQHDEIGSYQAPVQHLAQILLRHVIPTIKRDAPLAHNVLLKFSFGAGVEGYTKSGLAGEIATSFSPLCYIAPSHHLPKNS